MRKKLLALMLAVLLAAAALPMAASAAGGTLGGVKWNLDGGILTVSGSGAVPDVSYEGAPWKSQAESIKEIVIEDGITAVGGFVFAELPGVTKVTIGKDVVTLGSRSFLGTGTSGAGIDLDIPGNVKTISDHAFVHGNFKTIRIHEGVETIYSGAFDYTNLENIYLPTTVTANCGGDGAITGNIFSLKNIYYAGDEARFNEKLSRLGTVYYPDVPIHYNTPVPGGTVTPPKPTVGGFSDVFESEYYADPVKWAVENKITQGETSTTFAPDKTCTRGQIVTFLWRANGEPEPASTVNPFVDVKIGEYYYKAMLWAKEKGITSGTDDTHFSPNAACNRAQAVTFLWRANNSPAGSGGSFSDVKNGEYYTDAVKWAVQNGITNGETATTFAPNKSCTRGQIVTFLYRDKT